MGQEMATSNPEQPSGVMFFKDGTRETFAPDPTSVGYDGPARTGRERAARLRRPQLLTQRRGAIFGGQSAKKPEADLSLMAVSTDGGSTDGGSTNGGSDSDNTDNGSSSRS